MILVPVKNLANAKQRLSPLLEPHERTALAQAMVEDVFRTLAGVTGEVGAVTSDPFACGLAQKLGFTIIEERENRSETDAIELATRYCQSRGIQQTMVVPADIPLISAAEVEAVLSAAPARGCVIVPAADGCGTNAILRRPANLIPLQFGNHSFQPHLAAARASGAEVVLLQLPGIALDVDRPGDLAQLMSLPVKTRSQELVQSWNLAARLVATTSPAHG